MTSPVREVLAHAAEEGCVVALKLQHERWCRCEQCYQARREDIVAYLTGMSPAEQREYIEAAAESEVS